MTTAELEEAIELRRLGDLEASRTLLLELVEREPESAVIQYQCAWAHDCLGLERDAVPFYERAIALGLGGCDLEGALLGLGSTYRCLGDYRQALLILERGVREFPGNRAMQVFQAMALYNVGSAAQAMGIVLALLAETSSDPGIQAYREAIGFYSDKLNETW